MVKVDEDLKHNLMVNIARPYYLKRMPQHQIGQKPGLSRVEVTRFLNVLITDDKCARQVIA